MVKTYLFFDKSSKLSIGVMDMNEDLLQNSTNFYYLEATLENINKFNSGVTFKLNEDLNNVTEDNSILLLKKKQDKASENKLKYNASLLITFIDGGKTFTLDVLSSKGREFLDIVKNANGSCDEFQDKVEGKGNSLTKSMKIAELIINVLIEGKLSSRRCKMYNWFWQFVFEEVVTIKQKAETLFNGYSDKIDKAETPEELDSINIIYKSFTVNVADVIAEILTLETATLANGRVITVTPTIKEAIQAKTVLFEEINPESIITEMDTVLQNSFFTIV